MKRNPEENLHQKTDVADALKSSREKNMETLESKGVNIVELSAEDKQEWAELAAEKRVPESWVEEVEKSGYNGAEILEFYYDVTTELGHKWPGRE